MKNLINYLLENMILDFGGDLTYERVRELLRHDDSRVAMSLMAKLGEDPKNNVSEMMITLADCLREYLRTGINEKVIEDQIKTYSES